MIEFIISAYPFFTLAASMVLLLAILVTGLAYRGSKGERYSILNHFISELGEVGVSRLAIVFNLAMILAGILFLPMMIGLGLQLQSIWGKFGMIAGTVAAVACFFVGIFPMNKMKPHATAAMTYFRSGLLTVLLFSIGVLVQPPGQRVIPLYVSVVGFFSMITYAVFLIIVAPPKKNDPKAGETLEVDNEKPRPRFWRTAFWEWLVFLSTLVWFSTLIF